MSMFMFLLRSPLRWEFLRSLTTQITVSVMAILWVSTSILTTSPHIWDAFEIPVLQNKMPANIFFGLAAAEFISGNAGLSLCNFVVPLKE